jgi:hypothetical protein
MCEFQPRLSARVPSLAQLWTGVCAGRHRVRHGARDDLIGNRLVLAGAVLYLLEWVAIIAASPPGPVAPGTSTAELVDTNAENAGGAAVSAAWSAICGPVVALDMAAYWLNLSGFGPLGSRSWLPPRPCWGRASSPRRRE